MVDSFAALVQAVADAGVPFKVLEELEQMGISTLAQVRQFVSTGAGTPALRSQLKAVSFTVWGATGVPPSPRHSTRSAPAEETSSGRKTKKGRCDLPVPQTSQGPSLQRALDAANAQCRQVTLEAFRNDIFARSSSAPRWMRDGVHGPG